MTGAMRAISITVATPDAVQVFREGQRQLSSYRSLIALHPEAEVSGIQQGVRRSDVALRDSLDMVLRRRKPAIDAMLAAYGVPRVDLGSAR